MIGSVPWPGPRFSRGWREGRASPAASDRANAFAAELHAGGLNLVGAYETLVLAYLAVLLFLHPYGIAVSEDANFRFPDVFALVALMMGFGAVLTRGGIKLNRPVFIIAGAFVFLELALPIVGAVGYRRPVDLVSAFRMAMFWFPMLFLTMIAPAHRSLRFEQRLASVLIVTLWLNFAYAVVQLGVALGFLPRAFLITGLLSPWTLDKNINIIQGLRPSGFLANSTGLSVLGVVCLCFFYARYIAARSLRDLSYAFLSIVMVVFTASRAAFAASALILLVGWFRLSFPRKATVLTILGLGTGIVLYAVESTVGIAETFYRFQRLVESGVLGDESFASRVYEIWPAAIEAARDYKVGTLIQAPRALPLIDSGYLNYYLQGKWVFIAALALLLSGLGVLGATGFFGGARRRIGIMSLFLVVYLSGAMIISNPLRDPLIVFFVVFVIWRISAEHTSKSVVLLPVPEASRR